MTEIRHPEPRPAEVVVATTEDVDCGEVRETRNACPGWCPGAALHPGWLHGSAGHEMIRDPLKPIWYGDASGAPVRLHDAVFAPRFAAPVPR